MNRFFSLGLAGLLLSTACGPTAEEKAAESIRIQDSITAADAALKSAEEAYAEEARLSALDTLRPGDTLQP